MMKMLAENPENGHFWKWNKLLNLCSLIQRRLHYIFFMIIVKVVSKWNMQCSDKQTTEQSLEMIWSVNLITTELSLIFVVVVVVCCCGRCFLCVGFFSRSNLILLTCLFCSFFISFFFGVAPESSGIYFFKGWGTRLGELFVCWQTTVYR